MLSKEEPESAAHTRQAAACWMPEEPDRHILESRAKALTGSMAAGGPNEQVVKHVAERHTGFGSWSCKAAGAPILCRALPQGSPDHHDLVPPQPPRCAPLLSLTSLRGSFWSHCLPSLGSKMHGKRVLCWKLYSPHAALEESLPASHSRRLSGRPRDRWSAPGGCVKNHKVQK